MKAILVFILGGFAAHAATVFFVTPPGATISSGTIPENAIVRFVTSANQIQISVANLQQETVGTVAQTISAIDWSFGRAVSAPTQIARSGDMITLNSGSGNQAVGYTTIPGGYAAYPTDRWNTPIASTQITNGLEITTLSGKNPDETIIGPTNAQGLYQSNGGLRGDNPFLQTNVTVNTALGPPTDVNGWISWTLQFNPTDNVNAATQVTQARMSFNTAFATTTELDLIVLTPEPGTPLMFLGGIAGLCYWRKRRA